jgi:hypothetical protein
LCIFAEGVFLECYFRSLKIYFLGRPATGPDPDAKKVRIRSVAR